MSSTFTDADKAAAELASLKRQVAALKVSEENKPSPSPRLDGSARAKRKSSKKADIFNYWQETASSNNATPPTLETPTNKSSPSTYTQHLHHSSPTFTPPLGRPPSSPSKLLFSPDKQSENTISSSRGEKWSPSSEIQTGGVAKFKQRFDHTRHESSPSKSTKWTPEGGVIKFKQQFDHTPESPRNTNKHMWTPKDDIDSNRINGIKAMWGEKTDSVLALPVKPPRVGKIDKSKFEPKTSSLISALSMIPPPTLGKLDGKIDKKKFEERRCSSDRVIPVNPPLAATDHPNDYQEDEGRNLVTPEKEDRDTRIEAGTPINVMVCDDDESIMSSIVHEQDANEMIMQQPIVADSQYVAAADLARTEMAMDFSEVYSANDGSEVDQSRHTMRQGNLGTGSLEDSVASTPAAVPAAPAALTLSRLSNTFSQDDDESTHFAIFTDGCSSADGTIESEESRHVSFSLAATGMLLDHLEEPEEDSKQDTTDGDTGQNYFYNHYNPAASPSPNNELFMTLEKRISTASSDATPQASGRSNKLSKALDIEEGMPPTKGDARLPLVVGTGVAPPNFHQNKAPAKAESEGNLSFETFSIGVSSQIGHSQNGGVAATGISEIPNPPSSRRVVWYKRRRTRFCACLALLLLATCGAALGLFFSGIFDQWFGNSPTSSKSSEEESVQSIDIGVLAPTTDMPSFSPSAYPTTACMQSLSTGYKTLGLGKSPNNYPPNVAIDGNSAAVVTNAGDIRFYALTNYLDVRQRAQKRWDEVDSFPNMNRSQSTPSISLSGNVAVVGFLYTIKGFDQGTGGARVYKRDDKGRWKIVDVLVPNDDDKNGDNDARIDDSAKFGWSVDVDAKRTRNPLIAVGAYGEAYGRGSVYVFELITQERRQKKQRSWIQVGKVLPQSCTDGNFGYSVAVSNNLISATSDCEYIVQINKYNPKSHEMESSQNIRYIDFELGAIGSLVMNDQNLVYSTVSGGIVIFQKEKEDRPFEFYGQLDFSGKQNLPNYPLALAEDLLVVGIGSKYGVFPKQNNEWQEGVFYIDNADASEDGAPSVAVSGRSVFAGSGSPHEVYHYDIELCMNPMLPTTMSMMEVEAEPMEQTLITSMSPTFDPTKLPNTSSSPSLSPAKKPTLSPSVLPTRQVSTDSPSFGPTKRPTLPPSGSPTSSSPSLSPMKKPTLSPSVLPTKQPADSPSFGPTKRPTLPPSDSPTSSSPSYSPTKKPTLSPSAPPTGQIVASTDSPSFAPTKKPSMSPLALPTDQDDPSSGPTKNPSQQPTISPTDQEEQASPPPEPSCYPVEITIQFDSSALGSGYVFNKLDTPQGSGLQINIDVFFPNNNSLANQEYTKLLCLEEGSYKFAMYDSNGDGLCCGNGNGEYAVSTSDGTIILAQGGEFGYYEDTVFGLPSSSLLP